MYCNCLDCGKQNAIAGLGVGQFGKTKEGQAPKRTESIHCYFCGKPIPETEFRYGAIPPVPIEPEPELVIQNVHISEHAMPFLQELKELLPDEMTLGDSHLHSLSTSAKQAQKIGSDYLRAIPLEIAVFAEEARRYRRIRTVLFKMLPLLKGN